MIPLIKTLISAKLDSSAVKSFFSLSSTFSIFSSLSSLSVNFLLGPQEETKRKITPKKKRNNL
jgi:hypothetical protein